MMSFRKAGGFRRAEEPALLSALRRTAGSSLREECQHLERDRQGKTGLASLGIKHEWLSRKAAKPQRNRKETAKKNSLVSLCELCHFAPLRETFFRMLPNDNI